MLEKLIKPLVDQGVNAVAKRGERTVAKEASGVVAKDVARQVLGQDARVVAKELPELAIKQKLTLLHADKFPIEAPRLSPNGKVVAFGTAQEHWLPEWFKKLIRLPEDQAPETLRIFTKAADGAGEPKKVAGRTFKNAVQPAFTKDGEHVIFAEQKHLPFGSGERLQEMRLRKADLVTGKVETIYDGHPTLLHPQVSPDGKQIVAYSRTPGHEGIYLLDAADPKKAPIRLTTMEDKHPIFSADGKRIIFHNQTGGALKPGAEDGEKAFIGMIDLTDPKAPRRQMIDEIGSETYHKHPAPIPNTDLVLYHAKDPGAKAHLEVVDTKTGQRARVKLDGVGTNGEKLKDFKHPAVSEDGRKLLVLGKAKKADGPGAKKDEWSLYVLDGVDQIVSAFKQAFKR
jgi:Tol biopolymer transport system component